MTDTPGGPLHIIKALLEGAGIPFMVVGAIDPDRFCAADVARDALRRCSMFNLVDMQSAWKIDLIVRKEGASLISPISSTGFRRSGSMGNGPARTLAEMIV